MTQWWARFALPTLRDRQDIMHRLCTFLLTALCVAAAPPSHAQVYPARTITLVVPYPAGGPTDTIARILAERMKAPLGQAVIVENISGAGGSIGVGRVAQ